MTTPTQQDKDNAARRADIAAQFQREHDEAIDLAESVFGPGWQPCGRHFLVDKQEEDRARKAGDKMHAAATVYSAQKDGVKRHFTATNGITTECMTVEEGFGGMYDEKHPTKGIELQGQWIAYPRYSLFWAGYETYSPRTAEQLAAAREKREQKAVEQDAQKHPLFADAIRSGKWRPERSRRPR